MLLSGTRALSASLKPIRWRAVARDISSHVSQRAGARCLHATAAPGSASRPPKSRDRGPKSDEDTQTDFGILDVLRNTAAPATAIDVCTHDGFAMNNGMRLSGSGLLLVGGEAFRWRPWLREGAEGSTSSSSSSSGSLTGRMLNAKGQWDVSDAAWGLLELVWPKPGESSSRAGVQLKPTF